MVDHSPSRPSSHEPKPLHKLMSQVLTSPASLYRKPKSLLPTVGTLQSFNQALERYPLADFVNSVLRGIGQVIFINNPISGVLILVALFIQSSWVGAMGLLGVVASTVMALMLTLDRNTIRNGIFGYNGALVGVALATFSDPSAGGGLGGWAIAILLFAAFSTILMHTVGKWWVKKVNTPPLTLPFIIATLMGFALAQWVPQLGLDLTAAPPAPSPTDLNWPQLLASLPIGVGQVFLVGKMLSGVLIVIAVALCSPLAAVVGILGCALGIWAGLLLGIAPNTLYLGLWGYNAVLCAMAIGGMFYVPNGKSILMGAIAAFLSALLGGWLTIAVSPLGLPTLHLSFCIVTIVCFLVLQRSLPSLVPVALHSVISPEEHRQRFEVARSVIAHFRLQLAGAIAGQRHCTLFDNASTSIKGDLRYLFNSIDTDQRGTLSTDELASHLYRAHQVSAKADLDYLFSCIDVDGTGTIDVKEFGEIMLRHRRRMANSDAFVTYFLPMDTNGEDAISLDEMNGVMTSVGERPLSGIELGYLKRQMGEKPMTWNRFIEMVLVT